MDAPDRSHWWGEEHFPWVGIALGALLGLAIVPVAGWVAFELIDCSLERWTP